MFIRIFMYTYMYTRTYIHTCFKLTKRFTSLISCVSSRKEVPESSTICPYVRANYCLFVKKVGK